MPGRGIAAPHRSRPHTPPSDLLVIEWGGYFGFLYTWFMNWRSTSTESKMVYGR